MTNCAPILKQRSEESATPADFYGTVCLDIDPSGPLNEFFVTKKRKDDVSEEGDQEYQLDYATYLVFNNDEAFDSITDVENSEFKSFVKNIVGRRIEKEGDWLDIQIDRLQAWAKRARIYDNKHVTWGNVDFKLENSEQDRFVDLKLFYVVENTFVDFRDFQLELELETYVAN